MLRPRPRAWPSSWPCASAQLPARGRGSDYGPAHPAYRVRGRGRVWPDRGPVHALTGSVRLARGSGRRLAPVLLPRAELRSVPHDRGTGQGLRPRIRIRSRWRWAGSISGCGKKCGVYFTGTEPGPRSGGRVRGLRSGCPGMCCAVPHLPRTARSSSKHGWPMVRQSIFSHSASDTDRCSLSCPSNSKYWHGRRTPSRQGPNAGSRPLSALMAGSFS